MLELKSVKKLYTPATGIFDISISIPHGQIVAFIGPNGAGKSTLFNIIGRVLKANSGTCTLDGTELSDLHISDIGFLPETMFLLEEFTPLQMLQFMNTMKDLGVSNDDIKELIYRFGVDAYVHKKIKQLSYGMRKRVSLACALLGKPKLLVLDEPINSLDIQSVLAFKEILKECKERGIIILLSSHILDFLDSNVDQVVFLKQGSILEISSNITERVEDLYRKLFF